MSNFKAQTDQIVVEDLGDECVIYQTNTKRAHSLNPTAAWIWRHCDGSVDVDQMILQFQHEFACEDAPGVVASGLQQLEAANLVIATEEQAGVSTEARSKSLMTRRSAVGVGSALMPVIASILVPPAAAAQSRRDGPPTTVNPHPYGHGQGNGYGQGQGQGNGHG